MNKLCYKIIGAAIEVHKTMGPGLFESIYEECLMAEFEIHGINAVRQFQLPLTYKGRDLENKFVVDILVEDQIVLELKSVKEINPVHHAQIISYLKLSDKKLGLLINFNVAVLKQGIKRFSNGFPDTMMPTMYSNT